MAFDPNKALAIIFGASQWPNLKLPDSSSTANPFQAAAQGMRDYFVNSLQLPAENVLFDGVFDSPADPAVMVRTINAFLAGKTKETEPNNTDLFIYFVGHGAFAGNDYYLCIRSTGEERASQFDIEYLIDVIKPVSAKLRYCYIIIDACYSGGALYSLSNINKVRTMLLCSSNRKERSQGAMEEITRFTGALLTVLKQPHPGDMSFAEVFSSGLEHITPTPEIHDINPRGSFASKAKVLRSYSTDSASSTTSKVGYDSLFPPSTDYLFLQQLQASLQPQLGGQSLVFEENSRQQVVKLSLAGLDLSTVPEVVWQFKQLRKLDLYKNRLETLPEAVGNLKGLNYLRLERNQLRELPASLGNLQRLERLDLRTNQLRELPEEVTAIGLGLKWQPQNKSEKGIFLADNPLEVPPRERVEKGIERVDLEGYFKQYPREIRKLERALGRKLTPLEKEEWSLGYRLGENQQVVELVLTDIDITEVPKEVWQLQQLQTLRLKSTQITELPAEIGQLKRLKKLWSFFNHQLTRLSSNIKELKELENLDLRDNRLTELPKEIGELSKLTWLNLWSNQLKQLPNEIGNLQQLRQIFLASNRLEQLPDGIWQLKSLSTLDVQNNQLKELPKDIERLPQLRYLRLQGNQLTKLPKEIGNLKELRGLNLSNNHLTELPQEIVMLNLEFKWEVPEGDGASDVFDGISLGGNPLQIPPPEVIQQGREAVVKYFQERGK